MTIFKEEKIPGKGSGCTSISSLTIDDDLPGGVSDEQNCKITIFIILSIHYNFNIIRLNYNTFKAKMYFHL